MLRFASRGVLAIGFATGLIASTFGPALAQEKTGTVPLAVPVGTSTAAVPVGGGSLTSGGGSGSVPAPVIMIIDDTRIIGNSKAFKSIQSQLDAQRQAYQKEFSGKQNELETAAADLQREQRSGSLSADAAEEKRHALVKRQEEIQRDADGRQHALQQSYAEALDKVRQALLEVVQGLAQERHANLVLSRSAVPLFDRAYDASTEAATKLDARLTSVQVVAPTGQTAATASASQAATPAKKR